MDNGKYIYENGLTKVPESYWIASTQKTDYMALNSDIKLDVAIIGGGMAGITSAYLLKKEGLKVAVIEADRILQGTTGHTTAKVTSQHGLIYNKIKSSMGEEKAGLYANANEFAINFIGSLVKEKNIDCDFERESAYIYTGSDDYVQKIMDEADTASSLGIKASYIEKIPLPISVKCGVRFDNQAKFHPRKYLLALAKEIPGDGCNIFEKTKVVDIKEGNPCQVITNEGKKVMASNVIIASHFPCYDGLGLYFARMYPERSYVLGIKIKDKFPGGMYINAEEPGRSLRSQRLEDGELILVGGESHKTGQGGPTMIHYENLKNFAEQTFSVLDIPYRWSTQDYETMDGVPFAGHLTSDTPNIYVATGFGKWGMTNTTVSAMILRDLIVKGESPWEVVYTPSRSTPTATTAKNYIVENLNVAGQLIKGKLSPIQGDVEIKNGKAKVIQVEGKRVGAYRDDKGKLFMVDTTCTHMGCELMWNDGEKTWDCPCHGSRFTYEGDIVEGPAHNRLNREGEKANKIEPNII